MTSDASTADAPSTDHAVGGDLLAGPHDEPVADAQLGDRHAASRARRVEHRDVRGAEVEQGAQRAAGAALGAGLEVATGEDQRRRSSRRPRGRCGACSPRVGTSVIAIFIPSSPASVNSSAPTARSRTRRSRRSTRACPSSRRRGAGSSTRRGGTATPPRSPPARRARAHTHCQLRNCSADHRQQQHRARRARRRRPGAGAGRRERRRRRRPARAGRRTTAGRHRADRLTVRRSARRAQLRRASDVRRGLLGGVVDGGRDAVEAVELLLDARRARRAGHARDVEVDRSRAAAHASQPRQTTS